MTTITDVPCVLLYHIIYLLVKSSGGAADFARIISVCRNFLLYAEDVSILRVVNFNIKIGPVNFYDFQNVKGLLVKCSEAGNVAAQHALGKVILLSSTHLFLISERQVVKYDVSPCDLSMLNRRILDTTVPARNSKVSSFMTYFSPLQVCTSEFSPTRLVHYQLVKLFLLNGSHHDFIRMGVFLRYCIKYFTGVTRENSPLIASIKLLVGHALYVRKLAKMKESFCDYFRGVREFLKVKAKHLDNYFEDPSSARSDKIAEKYVSLKKMYMWKCGTVGVSWREAMSDVNFVEVLRQEVSDQLSEAYINFSQTRAAALGHFENKFG